MKKTIFTTAMMLGAFAPVAFAQMLNPGFEQWDSLTLIDGVRIYNPVDWNSSNTDVFAFNQKQTVEMTTDAHTGNYAAKLTSTQDDQQLQATFLSSGAAIGDGPDDPQTGKFPLNGRINGFEGYYKYFPSEEDSFRVFLALYRDGQYIGQSYMEKGTATDTYTKFSWSVNYPATISPPDSAKFIIEPSIFDGSEGSVLYIDDLTITYGSATGITEQTKTAAIRLYPNPATDHIAILGHTSLYTSQYRIMNLSGKLVQSGVVNTDGIAINELTNGLYFLALVDENGQQVNYKFIKH